MRAVSYFLSVVIATLITCGCRSPSSSSPAITAPASPPTVSAATSASGSILWLMPTNLPTFGTAKSDSIRVAVFGGSVQRPGYYFLPRGAVLRDAVDAAGLKRIVGWRDYSGIARWKPDGSSEMIPFPSRLEAESMLLNDGDQIQFSHEVF